ncbi:zinc finger CCCH-type with G patch domain-containing protein-like [Physella acuta]|uniref:zinc finger CCCH-type with G patch domain-containing protein-like n=1 Tax=Physella acuta TaxID=109671 RepID=UPI0027DAC9FF|nr:zinc finger CCCH-type with G patch domain-containing protein-like [Physella acuta]
MSTNEEAEQEASLELYSLQLSQVEQAIQAAGGSDDLIQLKNDLQELISLTKENLLQIKKARLLKELEDAEELNPTDAESTSKEPELDEYSAFQAALSGQPETSGNSKSVYSKNSKTNNEEEESSEDSSDVSSDELDSSYFSELIGTKCRAPFYHEWGGHHYGNAMIWSVNPPSENDDISNHKVRVIFLNPVHPSLIPCKFYMDGDCRFSDDDCRRSHGHPVAVSELKPYAEPDHSKICSGCRCLAKYTDDVWYPGTITDVCDDHQVNVQFDAQKLEATVLVEHVLPLDDSSSDSDSGEGTSGQQADPDDDDGDVPVYLWKPAQTTDKLGAWETHTKGIGSKLMAKMGYITGQGLGPKGDGRAEPVPILLLPQGKSLDKIMELKELSGNADLFNAMKKLEKRQKHMEKKAMEKEQQRELKESWGVFGFINKKLGHKDQQHKSHRNPREQVTQSTEKDLSNKSDKEVNVQIFKTSEEIKSVEKHLQHLKQQLARNLSRDKKLADSVSRKISDQEKYLAQLQTSSKTLETHRDRRSAHKKLTIF